MLRNLDVATAKPVPAATPPSDQHGDRLRGRKITLQFQWQVETPLPQHHQVALVVEAPPTPLPTFPLDELRP